MAGQDDVVTRRPGREAGGTGERGARDGAWGPRRGDSGPVRAGGSGESGRAWVPGWLRWPPRWWVVLLVVVAALGLYYLVNLLQVVSTGRSDQARQVDAIVVLGAAQYDGRPSAQLAARLDHALDLWERGLTDTIVVTGGNQPGDRFTEAETSRDYLVEGGVDESAIVLENAGATTWESLDGVAQLLMPADGDPAPTVLLVTDRYHAKRSQLIADEVGLDPFVSPAPDGVVTGWASVRRHLQEAAGISLGRVIGFERLSELTG